MSVIARIYDRLRERRGLCLTVLLFMTAVLAGLLSQQRYKEDISDFLPLDSKYGRALKVYQEIAGSSRVVAIVSHADTCSQQSPDVLTEAVDAFAAIVQERDTMGIAAGMVTQIDVEQMETTAQFVYANMPYFLTDADYARMDSLLADSSFISERLSADKQMLLLPMAGMMSESVRHDPLNIFTPVTASLQKTSAVNYENYDGYIFTPDTSRAIVLMQSPFGGSETSQNARLLRFLEECAAEVDVPAVDIHFTGGPIIAVGNAEQIKSDSMLAVVLALVLIVALLYAVFRRWQSLVLIVVSIGWGWLFAMAVLALLLDSVSVIVIGISSVIMGIAVNYPLHLIAHHRHTPDVRQALREIAVPLVVGNITTVGAFLALVPLESVALRDLGLFSALLLVGTILFVLIFLPQLISGKGSKETPPSSHGDGTEEVWQLHHYPVWIPAVVVVLTIVLGYFSLDTTFDPNIANINYMSERQRQDMECLASMTSGQSANDAFTSSRKTVYVVSTDTTLDAALSGAASLQPLLAQLKSEGKVVSVSSCHPFLCSHQEQRHRLSLWRQFVDRHGQHLEGAIRKAARDEGFADDTFDKFFSLLHRDFQPQPQKYFDLLATTVFTTCLAYSDSVFSVVETLTLDESRAVSDVEAAIDDYTINSGETRSYAFDVRSMNSAIATRLSDDFNYIGWACGLIVFLFLWFSMGSLELAVMSFLPMAVSWVWILGLMSLLGIHFNVVNIILATFIFGQGDDYTIFMTEGCQYEYAYRRPMLASYKKSIILSAIIMFVGIGTLIFAQHPALRSLAQVTIVGMFCVVLMSWLLPPLIFRWLVAKGEVYRRRPLSLSLLWYRLCGEQTGSPDYLRHLVFDRYRYKGLSITRAVGRHLRHFATSPAGRLECSTIVVVDSGYGELPLLLALQNPDAHIFAIDADPEKLLVARNSAHQLAQNITFMEKTGPEQIEQLRAANPELQIIQL